MADPKKVSWAQLKVGVLALAALAFVILLVFLLTSNTKFFTKDIKLHTFVDDAASVQDGAAVRINGILAGKVKKVGLSGTNTPRRVIRIDFVVDEEMLKEIPDNSVLSISSDNLLGSTKFINIKKGDHKTTVKEDAEIQSLDTRQFDEVVAQGYSVLGSLQGILQQVEGIVGQVEVGKGTIGKLLVDETLYDNLNGIVNQVQQLARSLNSKKGTIGKLVNDDQLYNDVRGSLDQVNTVVNGLQQGQGTAGKLLKDPALYDDLRKGINDVDRILADLNAGKGTAGQLLKDPKIAQQLSDALTRVNTTIDKINSGQGTIGQLIVNPQLYDAANGATRELHQLLKDFRANPKKFLRVKFSIF